MANRYWVGGTANWDTTAGTKWATTSGGAGGEAVPTSSDDVFFDDNSGDEKITISGSRSCKTINCTNFIGELSGSGNGYLNVYGDITLGSDMKLTLTPPPEIDSFIGKIWLINTNGNLTTNGVTIPALGLYANGYTLTLQDDLTVSSNIYIDRGTFNANNKNVTTGRFYTISPSAPNTNEIQMGSGDWIVTNNIWEINSATTLTKDTANLKFTSTFNGALSFNGGGKTYNDIWFNRGTSTGIITITGSNTFANFKDTGTEAHTIKFTDETTQTITSLDINGSSGKLITLTGTSTDGWTISDTTGTNLVEYCDISYSTAEGGAIWNAKHSTDGGNNTGWNFILSTSNFFQLF
jgi:hypothetical protein